MAHSAAFAIQYLKANDGWGAFTIAEVLSTENLTWTALWFEGRLQVCQLRERILWKYRHLAPSGITGITGIQRTAWEPEAHAIALRAVAATVARPHGIVSVDMTADRNGTLCPTEIQTSRFFTSIDFLAELGLNFPDEYCRLALDGAPRSTPLVNPIRDEYYWIRGVDQLPKVLTKEQYSAFRSM